MSVLDVQLRVAFGAFTLDARHAFAVDGITALYGHSGSGKSTLLRAVAGFEARAEGRVALGDACWLDSASGIRVPAHRRGVGYVFQDVRLFAHLTVAGNLRYAERRSRAVREHPTFDEVVDAFDLAALLGRRVGGLSGGERQRVALARTLLARPGLLLFDEPLSALDMRRKAEILPYIREIPERFGVGSIYVTHALDEVTRLADRMAVLSDGRIVAHGEVAEVLERLDLGPLTGRFEAGVVLSAQVRDHDDAFHLTTLSHGAQTLVTPRIHAKVGTAVRLRVRARDVSLALERPRGVSIRNLLEGTVSELREEADTAYAEVLVDIGGAQLRARLTRLSVSELGLAPGRPVVAMVKSIALDRPGVL